MLQIHMRDMRVHADNDSFVGVFEWME